MMHTEKTDVLIVGAGVSGLYCALSLPKEKRITVISKDAFSKSDSYLAQGGICVLRDESDYDSFFEDTMRAGHFENDKQSVDIMIRSSEDVISDLISYGVEFEKNGEDFLYTKEGAHSVARILFHQDITGKEITSHLLSEAQKRENITLKEHCTMVDLITVENTCRGIVLKSANETFSLMFADYTVLATGGIGGLFPHSTNYKHLTGDGIAVALKHGVALKDESYVQIHPTTLYTEKEERSFLISESVRGEGAILLNKNGERFTDELKPRDVVTNAILKEMKNTNAPYVHLSLENIPKAHIKEHFPHIYARCLKEGFDITKEPIPVVPAQHYYMGGISVNHESKTSMQRLYAVGETACNGVHGKNRLASNSLLESLVFSKRAAMDIAEHYEKSDRHDVPEIDMLQYENYIETYKTAVLSAIKKERKSDE